MLAPNKIVHTGENRRTIHSVCEFPVWEVLPRELSLSFRIAAHLRPQVRYFVDPLE
jgi:hypothetical protein